MIQELMANPDPRVKWAMDVFDQEGEVGARVTPYRLRRLDIWQVDNYIPLQDFSTLSGKMMGPVSCATFPVMGNVLRNGINRVPLRYRQSRIVAS